MATVGPFAVNVRSVPLYSRSGLGRGDLLPSRWKPTRASPLRNKHAACPAGVVSRTSFLADLCGCRLDMLAYDVVPGTDTGIQSGNLSLSGWKRCTVVVRLVVGLTWIGRSGTTSDASMDHLRSLGCTFVMSCDPKQKSRAGVNIVRLYTR